MTVEELYRSGDCLCVGNIVAYRGWWYQIVQIDATNEIAVLNLERGQVVNRSPAGPLTLEKVQSLFPEGQPSPIEMATNRNLSPEKTVPYLYPKIDLT